MFDMIIGIFEYRSLKFVCYVPNYEQPKKSCSRESSASQAEPIANLSRACNLAYSNVLKFGYCGAQQVASSILGNFNDECDMVKLAPATEIVSCNLFLMHSAFLLAADT